MFIFHGESVSEVLILSTKGLLIIRIRKLSMEASIQSIYIIVTNIYDIPWDCVRLMVPALSQLCLTYKDINSVWAGGLEVRGCCGGVSVDVSSSVSRLGSLLLRPRGDHAAATSPALCLHSAAPHTSGPGLLPRHSTSQQNRRICGDTAYCIYSKYPSLHLACTFLEYWTILCKLVRFKTYSRYWIKENNF